MKDFKVYIPLSKGVGSDLIGIASATSVDRDGERMSDSALEDMKRKIKEKGVNLFGNHNHDWENTLGVIRDANIVDKQLNIDITLDDAQTNPKVNALLTKLKKGIALGLSVGGSVTKERWDYDKELGKKVKVIDGVDLYEVSVVGIPSNADSFVSLPQAIAKSRKEKSFGGSVNSKGKPLPKCPKCGTQMRFYDGSLGYSSIVCPKCNYDVNDDSSIKSCPACFSKMLGKKCPICLYKSCEVTMEKGHTKYERMKAENNLPIPGMAYIHKEPEHQDPFAKESQLLDIRRMIGNSSSLDDMSRIQLLLNNMENDGSLPTSDLSELKAMIQSKLKDLK